MRWVVVAIRTVFGLALIFGMLVAPEAWGWQVVGGIAYVMGALLLITAFDDGLDIVDLALYGISGPTDSPLRPKRLLERALFVFLFWFVVLSFGLVLTFVPFSPWPHRALGPGYFLAGTAIGAVIYLTLAGWYRKSMRRRYGY